MIYIYTSECKYQQNGSVLLVSKQNLNEEQLEPLILNEDTKSIYSNYYICTRGITNNRTPSYNEKKYEFIIDNLPPYLMVPKITLSKYILSICSKKLYLL